MSTYAEKRTLRAMAYHGRPVTAAELALLSLQSRQKATSVLRGLVGSGLAEQTTEERWRCVGAGEAAGELLVETKVYRLTSAGLDAAPPT